MATAADQSGYGNSGMGGAPYGAPWGASPYGGPPWGHPSWGFGPWLYASKPLWIVAMVLGFIFFWPLGLILLALMIGYKRMGCWGYGRYDGYNGSAGAPGWQGGAPPPWSMWKRQWKQQMRDWCRGSGQAQGYQAAPPSSGNRAFDEYRAETLRRLEEEQKEFGAYLERLRFAKDKAEFDQFMAELRNRPPATQESPGPQPQG